MATSLESAAEAMVLAPETGRPQFFRLFADTPLLLLLEAEAEGEVLSPRVFDLAEGRVVLAFESEALLAAMGDGPLPYAELPGRVLAQLLADASLGLGLNLGSGLASEQLLPVAAMVWLVDLLSGSLEAKRGNLDNLAAPDAQARDALGRVIAGAPLAWAGLASAARLYSRDDGLVLIVEGADPEFDAVLAQSLAEALRSCDLGGRIVDIAFAHSDRWPTGGALYDWPRARVAIPEASPAPAAPGMNPKKPPILR